MSAQEYCNDKFLGNVKRDNNNGVNICTNGGREGELYFA